eukprot:860042-Pleurochrysis_carterae.AAC.4
MYERLQNFHAHQCAQGFARVRQGQHKRPTALVTRARELQHKWARKRRLHTAALPQAHTRVQERAQPRRHAVACEHEGQHGARGCALTHARAYMHAHARWQALSKHARTERL